MYERRMSLWLMLIRWMLNRQQLFTSIWMDSNSGWYYYTMNCVNSMNIHNGLIYLFTKARRIFVISFILKHRLSNIPKHPVMEHTQQSTNGVKDKRQTNQWENRSKVTLKCTTMTGKICFVLQAGRQVDTHTHTWRRVGGTLFSNASIFEYGLGTLVSNPNTIFVAISLWGWWRGVGHQQRKRRRWWLAICGGRSWEKREIQIQDWAIHYNKH